MKCERCGENFCEQGTHISDKQIISQGSEWIDAFCWNCKYPMRFLKKGSEVQKRYEANKDRLIKKHTDDLVRHTKKQGVVYDGDSV